MWKRKSIRPASSISAIKSIILCACVATPAAWVSSGCILRGEGSTELAAKARKALGGRLAPLSPLNYDELIGHTPSPAELELGRLLFSDPIMSRNNDVSCATCHLSNHGFADGNALTVGSVGQGGPTGDSVGALFGQGTLSMDRTLGDDGMGFVASKFMFRNVPSTINVAYRMNAATDSGLLLDGRFGDLAFQVMLPIHTPEELCGQNTIPPGQGAPNPFKAGGPFFKKPVTVYHSHSSDPVTGADTGYFNSTQEVITGIPDRRPDGTIPSPTRNECTALLVSKLRMVPKYRELFKKAFDTDEIDDRHIGQAIASYVMTHVADDTPYDRFVKGENALTDRQIKGMMMFFAPRGEKVEFSGETLTGAGCSGCHAAPEFGGKGFASLGVRSDPRSALSHPTSVADPESGFFARQRIQRGFVPNCHVKEVSVNSGYGPDIGRANATFKDEDCFKFRIPPLRNVIETYPYFHHGTERAIGFAETDLEKRALQALRNVVRHHLRGPISTEAYSRTDFNRTFADPYFQVDVLIPYGLQDFGGKDHGRSTVELSDEDLEALVDFVAYGLWDKEAVVKGSLGNDISHPREVPSGFTPTITRDHGTQLELPPNHDREGA